MARRSNVVHLHQPVLSHGGHLALATLREQRIQALLSGTVDAQLFVDTLEALEDVLLALGECKTLDRSNTSAEYADEAIREIERERAEEAGQNNIAVKEAKDRCDELERENETARKEHAAELDEQSKTIDELRERAERAEENEVVAEEALVESKKLVESLTHAVEVLRAKRTIKPRKI